MRTCASTPLWNIKRTHHLFQFWKANNWTFWACTGWEATCAVAQVKSLNQFDFKEVRSIGQHFSAFLILLLRLKYREYSETRLKFFKMGNYSGQETENRPDLGVECLCMASTASRVSVTWLLTSCTTRSDTQRQDLTPGSGVLLDIRTDVAELTIVIKPSIAAPKTMLKFHHF